MSVDGDGFRLLAASIGTARLIAATMPTTSTTPAYTTAGRPRVRVSDISATVRKQIPARYATLTTLDCVRCKHGPESAPGVRCPAAGGQRHRGGRASPAVHPRDQPCAGPAAPGDGRPDPG